MRAFLFALLLMGPPVVPGPAADDVADDETPGSDDLVDGDDTVDPEPPDQDPAEPGETGPGDDGELPALESPSVEDPESDSDDSTATEPNAVGPEAEGDLDLGDIFGTEEDHDVEVVPEGETAGKGTGPRGNLSKLAGGKLDLRIGIVTSVYVDLDGPHNDERWARSYPHRGRIGRNENRLEFYFAYSPNKHIQIVGDIEPVFFGANQVSTLNDLASRQMLAPFHVESDAAYVAILDIVPGLDIKLGRQIVVWGTADKFSPTNNLNSDDLEDRPLFTEPIANQMAVLEYSAFQDKLWLQTVFVPLFYPALLPPSASGALSDTQSPVPFAEVQDIKQLRQLQALVRNDPRLTPLIRSNIETPSPHIRNSQAGVRMGSNLGVFEFSGSYYFGVHDIPIPVNSTSQRVVDLNQDAVKPASGFYYESDVDLVYPRMHVAGLDFATQLPFLGNVGLWGEAGLFFPTQQHDFRIELPNPINFKDDDNPGPVTEFTGVIVKKQPFVKATVGLDYTIGKHVYLQTQYLRGMINEFGAGNIGNYLVAGTDLVFFGRHLIFRFFTVTDFPKRKREEPSSVVLAPDIIIVPPWGYVTLELGGFAFIGRNDSYFGQTATGSSIAYVKVAGRF